MRSEAAAQGKLLQSIQGDEQIPAMVRLHAHGKELREVLRDFRDVLGAAQLS
jgi:hypothetical protein